MYISYKIAQKLTFILIKNQFIKNDESSSCLFCLDYLIEMILFFLSTLLVSLLLKMPFLSILYFLILLSLRSNCGGFHASSRTGCTILSFFFFFMAFLMTKLYLEMPDYILHISMISCLFLIFFQKKTISLRRNFTGSQQKRHAKLRKLISLLLLVFFVIVYKLRFFSIAAAIVSCTNIAIINIVLAKYVCALDKRQ